MNTTPSTPPPGSSGPSLPPSPWVLGDTTTVEQTTTVLELLEEWLAGGNPAATEACPRACSAGEDDPLGVAAWIGTLAARLRDRTEEASSW
jgi:hypothetical protein